MTEPRFLVLRRRHGEWTACIEHGEHKRTRAELNAGTAKCIRISLVAASAGPVKLMQMARGT